MDLKNKRVGIWGFGIVGKAALNYFSAKQAHISVMDRRPLTPEEEALVLQHHANYYTQNHTDSFLEFHDVILPSPGIDLRPYEQYKNKWIAELDIFACHVRTPTISITGTVGKTTTTSLLTHLLSQSGMRVCSGGNIGTCMLDLIKPAQDADVVVLELSSFQLELSKKIDPSIALWTNFFPNHLDRHGSQKEYFNAKQKIMAHQTSDHYAILPLDIIEQLDVMTRAQRIFFSTQPPRPEQLKKLHSTDLLFYVQDKLVIKQTLTKRESIIALDQVPEITFLDNMLAIVIALTILKIPLATLTSAAQTYTLHEHRLEKIGTINDIDIYNDSKSTIMQATLAAVDKLSSKPIILLVGGVSKGVDRASLFTQLKNNVRHLICFGKEAPTLYTQAMEAHLTCHSAENLEQAVTLSFAVAKPGDQILFSPAGASFDLFENYQARGSRFKELVETIKASRV